MPFKGGLVLITVALVLGACAEPELVASAPGPAAPIERREPESGLTVAPISSSESSAESLSAFSLERAMKHVRKLANDIGVRVRATKGERRAATYIRNRFRRFGYRTRVQRFDVDGKRSRNVVAWWPGSVRHGLVVGAHMDTVSGSPGANDNASGVAVILELARLSAGSKPARFVRWVAFGSEEYGANGRHHVGSQVYVNRLKKEGRRRLGGMLSVDMIADGRPLLIGTAGIGPENLARYAYRRMRRTAAMQYRTMCDCSDNGPFERAGIPGAFAWSGYEPDYHDSTDTPPNLRKRHLRRTGRAVKAFVASIDGSLIRRLRRTR